MSDAPMRPTEEQRRLERLAQVVAEDVVADLNRETDRARNEARRVVHEAEERAETLAAAARRLGSARGSAVQAAAEREAERQARAVTTAAFDALAERFVTRVRLALQALPGTPPPPAALTAWAREAAVRMDRPSEVFVEAQHRPVLYEALLAAGARDFRVRADPRVHVGFVVRDLDGRTLVDRRPETLVVERRAELLELLRSRLPAPPTLPP
jgi:vacuolar-type H+-ATPase subunit E/Vma4